MQSKSIRSLLSTKLNTLSTNSSKMQNLMKRDSTQYFFDTGEGFQCDCDWQEVKPYLMPFQDSIASLDSQFTQRLQAHFQKCKESLFIKIPKIQEEISILYNSLQTDPSSEYKLPPVNPANRTIHLHIRFLIKKIVKLTQTTGQNRIDALTNQLSLLNTLIQLIEFFERNHKNILFKINRAIAPVDRTVYSSTRPKTALLHMIKRQVISDLIKIHLIPIPFRSGQASRDFLKEVVDAGVLAKKPGTSYFVELPAEEALSVFFQSPKSPLCQKRVLNDQEIDPLLPYNGNTDPSYVKNWIFEATSAVSEWLKIAYEINEEQEASISILLERFLFSSTYPLLYPPSAYNEEFAQKMVSFAKKTPIEIGILTKYIPKQCSNRPVSEIFEVDSISRAPAEWFRNAVVQVCPIDAAYCIVKVHESLSVMAVLRATSQKENSQVTDFVEKMPGFDDIFEIWLSLLCVNGSPDPQRLMNFIEEFSRLPGFSARVMASIAYLEASLSQLQSPE
ncbi:hypothetical protein TRFO_42175 [Tritrichomonas foetus]|uniref:VPS9 domain-containing protein n=1 Tax=Tritrichomonas foetus TaxID=1144522 RepID=A0A1J4KXR4_9EUKA|nr:hypothetical protein TRFO_42175 [Tritrichomonas foetus]|eukprot:OHT15970.1 hypothetical protein TRFO_42175 [Tritrichomonas foetus]